MSTVYGPDEHGKAASLAGLVFKSLLVFVGKNKIKIYWDWIAWRYINITDNVVIMFYLNVWLPIVSTVPRRRTHIWTWESFRKPFIYVYPAGFYFVKNGPLYTFEVLYVLKVDAFLNHVVIYITCNIRLSMLYFVIVLIVMRAFLYSFRV